MSQKTLLFSLLLSCLIIWGGKAQTVLTESFESSKHETETPELWAQSSERASAGNHSLKYSVQLSSNQASQSTAYSFVNLYQTILQVRLANIWNKHFIITSSYEGTIAAVNYSGIIKWKNKLSGYMNHDIWCGDLTGDGNDEILAANADGSVYCLSHKGKLLWSFKKNDAPMYAVCVVHKNNTPYVVCGGFDKNIYYLNSQGQEVLTVQSSTYSIEKVWGEGELPPANTHIANFLRPMKLKSGKEVLVMHGTNNLMQAKGTLYLFEVLAPLPYKKIPLTTPRIIGDLRIADPDADGNPEIIVGTSGHHNDMASHRIDPETGDVQEIKFSKLGFGYSVTQSAVISDNNGFNYFFLIGNQAFIAPQDFTLTNAQKLVSNLAFYDVCFDNSKHKLIFASAQSGGSGIHIFDTDNPEWTSKFTDIPLKGKVRQLVENTNRVWDQLVGFTKPAWERDPLPVYFMTEKYNSGKAKEVAKNIINNNYPSPVFLNGAFTPNVENWDRSGMENEKYRNKRDKRKKYTLSQQEAVSLITSWYEGYPGVSYWGGHGNDPYMWQLSTTKQVLDNAQGKKTVLIYPEMTDDSEDFAWVINDLFVPLADYCKTRNGNIYVRSKHAFWQANVYLPVWDCLLSGKYSNVFVPSMEETTDKSMELSLAGRMGIWAAGSVDDWGSRSVPDNASFNRSRQFCIPQYPNHFLRHTIFSLANGARYINNFTTNPDYQCLVWELLAKGVLYVPKKNEILSFSPVHVSMLEPEAYYLEHSANAKWNTFYDEEFEANNHFVFGRLNGTWIGAPVTPWDFSNYAANVKERRTNFLPPYPNGLVLITPPQKGKFADTDAPRGKLSDHLHPYYKDILKEFYTDGKNYYSADGTQVYKADEYAQTVKTAIENKANKLPLTVTGEVAWVVAQTAPKHLRLTLVDSGYLNPKKRNATITFHTVTPVAITDLLTKESWTANGNTLKIEVPCGLFRFLDIKISEPIPTN